jgi:hypothetical protein
MKKPARSGTPLAIPCLAAIGLVGFATLQAVAAEGPPGVVIDHSNDPADLFFGSPSLAVLPNGDYVASHDLFGSGKKANGSITRVFRSTDRGQTWQRLPDVRGAFWSSLFVHRDRLYLFGPQAAYRSLVIRRSDDGGKTWTDPKDENTGVLSVGRYHSAPVPVVEHDGRLWRAVETKVTKSRAWGDFAACVVSAPANADLLKASNWTVSNSLPFTILPIGRTWLEGNIVVTPEGGLANVLRTRSPGGGKAARVAVAPDGRTISFDPDRGFIDFPGGSSKFTIRRDPEGKRYWSLVNYEESPQTYRNVLALTSSSDLKAWRIESIVLRHPDSKQHAWQYLDWHFDGDDIIAVSRTAWDESRRAHDADYFTFHRIQNFRKAATPLTASGRAM